MNSLVNTALVGNLLMMAACATAPSDPDARAEFHELNDPAEPTNRAIFGANQYVDRNLLKPVATAYKDVVPDQARRSVGNFTSNLSAPKVLLNDMLQGNVSRAWNTTQRFAVNSTLGAAGFFDVASGWGLPKHDADFGQTLGVWGVGTGPSVQVPLLGPSNVRDAMGGVVGIVTSPLSFIPGGTIATITSVGAGAGVLDGRAQILDTTNSLEASSVDYYATLRSISAQRRAALVEEGRAGLNTEQGSAGGAK